jgi:thymidine phosphorylase
LAQPGDELAAGDPLFELHTDDPARLERARAALDDAVTLSDERASLDPLVLERID